MSDINKDITNKGGVSSGTKYNIGYQYCCPEFKLLCQQRNVSGERTRGFIIGVLLLPESHFIDLFMSRFPFRFHLILFSIIPCHLSIIHG